MKNFRDIIGYQFTLRFDADLLDFQQVEMGELAGLSEANFGFRLLDEGVLTTSWNDAVPTSLPDGAVLFSLFFTAKENANLSKVLRINSEYTQAEAYFENGELLDLSLDFGSSAPIANGQLTSVLVKPNPFREATSLVFKLDEAQDATLTVSDAAGRLVMVKQGDFVKGYNELKISKLDLQLPGTYFFRLQTTNEVATGKLVLVD